MDADILREEKKTKKTGFSGKFFLDLRQRFHNFPTNLSNNMLYSLLLNPVTVVRCSISHKIFFCTVKMYFGDTKAKVT